MTEHWDVEAIADELLNCEATRRAREPFTDDWPNLSVQAAYAIQDETLDRRLQRGESLTGVKLGLTSRAKQARMGVNFPIVAWLTDAMTIPRGQPIPTTRFIHPRVEPEIVFVMGRDLAGPGATCATAMAAVELIMAGAEVIDSRYANFRFQAPDVIADNASSGGYIIGGVTVRPDQIDLACEAVSVEVDGRIVDTATGSAILGHPGEALALAANQLAERGMTIRAGQIVLTGGITDAYPVTGDANLVFRFAHLGSIHLFS